jgi:hypothetical protein
MGWVAFLFLALLSWLCFDSGANMAGVLGLISAFFFFPPLVSRIKDASPDFDHAKRITTGCGLAVLSFLFFAFTGPATDQRLEQTYAEISADLTDGTTAQAGTTTGTASIESSGRIDIDMSKAKAASEDQANRAKHTVAALINLNGELCADVTHVRLLTNKQNSFEVTCVEYRGDSHKVRYFVNGITGEASRL